jgi:hypothetical protein
MMLDHQVKVADPFAGIFAFHPVAHTVSDDDDDGDDDDHNIFSSMVKSQTYLDSSRNNDKSLNQENTWTHANVEVVASNMIFGAVHEQRTSSPIPANDSTSYLDHVAPSTAPSIKEVEGAAAPNRGRRRRLTDCKKNQDQRMPLQPSFKPSAWDVVSGVEVELKRSGERSPKHSLLF